MAEPGAGVMSRVLYGLLFTVVLPLVLVGWAAATAEVVALPALRMPVAGALLALGGALLMASGWHALWRFGGGLPMNAFPPPRYVQRGVYRYTGQPIYVGAVLVCAGVSVWSGSASGLWLVTPAVAAGAAALVLGYERPDLRRRFGAQVRRPLLALPRPAESRPSAWDRVSVYALVLLPWLIAYEAVQLMGVPPDAMDSRTAWERDWRVLEWTEAPYASAYVLVLLAPLLASTRRALHRFALTGLVATVVVTIVYLTVPLVAPPRPFEATTWLGRLLAFEQSFNHTVAAFPAFHVLWALIAADAWPRPTRRLAFVWAAVIAASCVTAGMHSVADVAAALVLFPVLRAHRRIWDTLRAGAEAVANSWREWRLGPVRVISHGAWAALGAGFGILIAGSLAGPAALPAVALVALCALLGAGLWAQWLEGSSVLLRPFGFYGGLVGGNVGILAATAFGFDGWLLLGAFAVAAPWIQAVGRLRCLVQGCCHGGPAPASVGIRYRHPRSRVSHIAGLAGEPLHPTPLYSIMTNVVIGVLIMRLWTLGAAPTFVAGAYFLLSGLARFVEESYRGEPQTRVIAGLHVYHWLAVASVLAGIVVSGVHAAPPPAVAPITPTLLPLAIAFGLVAGSAMGVDFPGSNRRYSRLAGTDPAPAAGARRPGAPGAGRATDPPAVSIATPLGRVPADHTSHVTHTTGDAP
jgi:protein-S-isoprenylcysteine O-methyltransferase Ste14